jgi:phosphatidylglycerophosphatase A
MVRIAYYIFATGLGTGYLPLAPGTAGSLLSLFFIYWFIPIPLWIYLLILCVLFFGGVYSSTAVEREHGHDPSIVVIDEIVGMAISLLLIPRSIGLFIIAFLLFRIFDILKPPPIYVSQKLPAGWGIMIDDVIAGFYTLVIIHIIRFFAGF